MKPKAGCKIYRNKYIPINAKIFKNKLNQECYLSGITKKQSSWYCEIYIFETDSFSLIGYDKVEPYLIN